MPLGHKLLFSALVICIIYERVEVFVLGQLVTLTCTRMPYYLEPTVTSRSTALHARVLILDGICANSGSQARVVDCQSLLRQNTASFARDIYRFSRRALRQVYAYVQVYAADVF